MRVYYIYIYSSINKYLNKSYFLFVSIQCNAVIMVCNECFVLYGCEVWYLITQINIKLFLYTNFCFTIIAMLVFVGRANYLLLLLCSICIKLSINKYFNDHIF